VNAHIVNDDAVGIALLHDSLFDFRQECRVVRDTELSPPQCGTCLDASSGSSCGAS
jgi:hypothetical protein